jgi:hypothetical protein
MNPFTAIPATVRKWLYLVYGIAGLTLGSVTAYVTAVGQPIPDVVTGVSAVLVVVGAGFGFTAASNTTSDKPQPAAPYTGGH